MTLAALLLVGVYVICDELQQHSEKNGWKKRLHPTGGGFWNLKARVWLNNKTSWENKHNWQPSWLFKTALVSLTDGEHFFQMLKHVALAGVVAIFIPMWWGFFAAYGFIACMSFIMNEVFLRR